MYKRQVNGVQTVMQTGTVKGQVVDANGEPIIGASVLVKGTTNGTITDFDGNFTLNNASKGILVVSVSYTHLYPDKKGGEYYIDYVLNRSSIRQWSLKQLADYGYDTETGIWAE